MRAHETQAVTRADRPVGRSSANARNSAADRLLHLQRLAGNAAVSRAVEEERHTHGSGCGHPEPGQADEGPAVQRRVSVGEALASPGSPLEPRIRSRAEQAYGMSFDHVRVHTGPVAQRSAVQFGAIAYTTGSDIFSQKPRLDDETMFHEVDHVHQQAMGPVAGTDHGGGAKVSDENDAFERRSAANGRRLAQGMAPDLTPPGASGHSASVQRAPDAAGGAAVAVQRKGHEELKGQIKSPPSIGARLWSAMGRPAPKSARTEPVRTAIDAYDSATERDPKHCMKLLGDIQIQVFEAMEGADKADRTYLEEALGVITNEVELLGGQVNRDDQMPPEAAVPYQDMTDRGPFWKDEESQHGTGKFAMGGASYVREMSEMNRADQRREIGPSEAPWIKGVRTKLTSALQQSVVAHYTPLARSKGIEESADKSLKSKTKLDQENVGDKHNTMNVDQLMLANDGFVFFYIEPAGMQGRKSRFGLGKDDEGPRSRIELGLEESGLLSQGWLMLSDFVQRDYPEMHTVPGQPDQLVSEESRDQGSPSEVTRKFVRGELDDEKLIASYSAFKHIDDTEERQAHQLARQTALMDQGNHMSYGPKVELKRPELLHNNILAGSDIIPGLVDRAVVEILRFEQANPPMAQRLKGMSGAELLDFLLRSLLKPQAMIPNSVDVSKAKFSTVGAG